MRRNVIIFFLFLCISCYGSAIEMNDKLESGMNYILSDLVPKYYNGQTSFEEERKKCSDILLGTDDIFHTMPWSENLIYNFYFLIDHDFQSCQCLMIADGIIDNELYEYWCLDMADRTWPYNYSYFYLTKAKNKNAKREILDISKKYQETYSLKNGESLDLSINDLPPLYTVAPWESLESFKGTKYENKIVKWKKDVPYLRKMNMFEKLFYKYQKKAKR